MFPTTISLSLATTFLSAVSVAAALGNVQFFEDPGCNGDNFFSGSSVVNFCSETPQFGRNGQELDAGSIQAFGPNADGTGGELILCSTTNCQGAPGQDCQTFELPTVCLDLLDQTVPGSYMLVAAN
ncbi:hypothetical protein GE09DRAFT_1212141 [Coniochaeta sp. 2T2.1]|nr:hypothetical protein GE09DRAFT_1212141 [Coniochaeta sp. 2T2.1]